MNRIDGSISCHANAHVLYVLAKLGCIRDDCLLKIRDGTTVSFFRRIFFCCSKPTTTVAGQKYSFKYSTFSFD